MQGRGIGSMLLDEICDSFPEATRVRLEVDAQNARAIAFYISQGFLEVAKVAHCGAADSGIPALVMERASEAQVWLANGCEACYRNAARPLPKPSATGISMKTFSSCNSSPGGMARRWERVSIPAARQACRP